LAEYHELNHAMDDSASTDNIITPDDIDEAANGTCVLSENVEADDGSGRFQTGFGCLRCRPACLQFLAGPRWFLVFICLAGFCQSMVVNGLIGVNMSTIERRFALSSSRTAWILASYEISGAPALLVIGYLGLSLRRPMWIGSGLVLLGIGFGIYSIPHFAAPLYRYADAGESSNMCLETAWNATSNSSVSAIGRYPVFVLCL